MELQTWRWTATPHQPTQPAQPSASCTASGTPANHRQLFAATQLTAALLHPAVCRTPDLHSLLLNQDVTFVGGGNTKACSPSGKHGVCPPFCASLASGVVPAASAQAPSAGSSKASAQTRWACSTPSASWVACAARTTTVNPNDVPCSTLPRGKIRPGYADDGGPNYVGEGGVDCASRRQGHALSVRRGRNAAACGVFGLRGRPAGET